MARLPLIFILSTIPFQSTQSTTHITPYKFQLNFTPPPSRVSTPKSPKVLQTPAEDRLLGIIPDGMVSFPATYVPKPFGDGEKPLWIPHGYFNLCPFVRGPDIDPVWSQGCAALAASQQFNNFNSATDLQNFQLQAFQQNFPGSQQMQQQPQQQNVEPSWLQQMAPSGPIDFGMANMYGPIQQQEMYTASDSDNAYARRGVANRPAIPTLGSFWGGSGAGFWG